MEKKLKKGCSALFFFFSHLIECGRGSMPTWIPQFTFFLDYTDFPFDSILYSNIYFVYSLESRGLFLKGTYAILRAYQSLKLGHPVSEESIRVLTYF